jgi:hypothetical protein
VGLFIGCSIGYSSVSDDGRFSRSVDAIVVKYSFNEFAISFLFVSSLSFTTSLFISLRLLLDGRTLRTLVANVCSH